MELSFIDDGLEGCTSTSYGNMNIEMQMILIGGIYKFPLKIHKLGEYNCYESC
jgi:hypothetical protein